MLWDICLPQSFTRFVYMGDNYNILSEPKLTYQKANGIVKKVIEQNANNINILKFKIEENFKTIQCAYSLLYPKIYNRINNFGIKNKSDLDFVFEVRKQENKMDQLVQKLLTNYLHLQINFW